MILSPFPSTLVLRGKRDRGCRYKLFSSVGIEVCEARSRWQGCSAGSLGSITNYCVDGSSRQITDTVIPLGGSPALMVLRAATCDSPLTSSWKNFPWSKSLFSFIQKILEWQLLSTKPGVSTYRADESVGLEGREESHLVTRKVTEFSSLPLPTMLLSCFTNLGELSASLVPARTARKAARSCSISTWSNDGVNRGKKKIKMENEWGSQSLITCITSNAQPPSVPRDLCMGSKVLLPLKWSWPTCGEGTWSDPGESYSWPFTTEILLSSPNLVCESGEAGGFCCRGTPGLNPAVPSNVIWGAGSGMQPPSHWEGREPFCQVFTKSDAAAEPIFNECSKGCSVLSISPWEVISFLTNQLGNFGFRS